MQHETKIHELEGGARLLTIDIPNTISYYWASFFKAGYRYVETHKYEMPHLAEHLAFEGTQRFPDSLAFKIEVEKNGAHYNAHTNNLLVWYDFVTTANDLERIINLNMGQLQSPLYGEEQIRQQKEVIDRELNGKKENDGWRLDYLGIHNVLPKVNPDIDQRLTDISKITQADLVGYHRKHYGTKNADFIMSGDLSKINLESIISGLNKALAVQHTGEKHAIAPYDFNEERQLIYTYEPYREKQSLFSLRFIIPGEDEDTRAGRVALSHILTGGMSGRLMRKAREAGLTYGIGAASGTNLDISFVRIASQTNLEKLKELVELACNELAAVGRGEYSDDELRHSIGHMVGGIRRGNQVPASMAGWYADEFILGKTLETPEAWIARLERVDRKAISEAYEKYVRPENMVLTMIGKNLDAEKDNYQKLLASYFS